jgi:calcium-dependent protein kinase
LHINKVEKEDKLFAAFSYFDKDGSGYITQDELQKACEEFGIGDTRLEDIIGDIDQDNVSRPDFTIPIKIGKISMFNSSIIYFAGWTDRLQ